jgi:HEAT repeat protein
LREQVYADPRVAGKTKAFVCVLLRDPIPDEDGAELRSRYGIDGLIVSPQHLLLHSDGTLILRKEYWEPGDLESSVPVLVGMLARATKAHEVRQTLPALGEDAASRTAWLTAAQGLIRAGPDVELRRAAVREVAGVDKEGDALAALHALLLEAKDVKKEDAPVYAEILLRLGRSPRDAVVPGLCAFLEAKDPALRSHAAVSLEYVGSPQAVEGLDKRLAKEKDESVRSNLLRALGRCGAKDANVRKTLLRDAAAKSDRVAAGAVLGLSYAEGDAEAARGLEKLLKTSTPGLRRTALLWALVEIGDPKSGDAVRSALAEAQASAPDYYLVQAAAACFDGRREAKKGELDQGLGWMLNEKAGDPVRAVRRSPDFLPKGDFYARAE